MTHLNFLICVSIIYRYYCNYHNMHCCNVKNKIIVDSFAICFVAVCEVLSLGGMGSNVGLELGSPSKTNKKV